MLTLHFRRPGEGIEVLARNPDGESIEGALNPHRRGFESWAYMPLWEALLPWVQIPVPALIKKSLIY